MAALIFWSIKNSNDNVKPSAHDVSKPEMGNDST